MISPEDLVRIKQRLITAADAARQIATSPDQFVLYDEQHYRAVVGALISAKEDVLLVFAELDVLRAMFVERLQSFLMEGLGHGNEGDGSESVAAVQAPEGERGGEEVRQDDAGPSSGVPAGGPSRKRAKRPKPRRDQAADGPVQGELGPSDGAVQVDGSPDAV